jgi:uncharacterized protein YrrD
MRAGLDIVGLTARDESGRRKGTVRDVLFDNSSHRVIGIMIRRGCFRGHHEFVAFQYIRSIGRDRLIAGTGRRCSEFEGRENALQGKLVVFRSGQCLGRVADVYIDEATGDVKAYQIASGARRGPHRQVFILADSRPMIGDVMVVTDPWAAGRANAYPRLPDSAFVPGTA